MDENSPINYSKIHNSINMALRKGNFMIFSATFPPLCLQKIMYVYEKQF